MLFSKPAGRNKFSNGNPYKNKLISCPLTLLLNSKVITKVTSFWLLEAPSTPLWMPKPLVHLFPSWQYLSVVPEFIPFFHRCTEVKVKRDC